MSTNQSQRADNSRLKGVSAEQEQEKDCMLDILPPHVDGGEVMWAGNVVAVGNSVYPMWVTYPLHQHFVLRTVPIEMISDWLTKEMQVLSLDLILSCALILIQDITCSGIVNIKHLN